MKQKSPWITTLVDIKQCTLIQAVLSLYINVKYYIVFLYMRLQDILRNIIIIIRH